jgi:uncharacterized protein
MDFEWDPFKAAANIAKHGIDFSLILRVFDDPAIVIVPDPRDYGGEVRHRAIGAVDGSILVVCYTMRGHICRIISARRANRHERRAYSL